MKVFKKILLTVAGGKCYRAISEMYYLSRLYGYDFFRCLKYASRRNGYTRSALEAYIITHYHILEKGLTMPNRHMEFGKEVMMKLISKIDEYCCRFGMDNDQIRYAIGVIKAYGDVHEESNRKDRAYWNDINNFLQRYPDVTAIEERHSTRQEFYAHRYSSFETFSLSRHTVRDYASGSISTERILAAISIAATTPSACNRQYCKIHCITNSHDIKSILQIQGGSRGFGHLSDKLLIVTADWEGVIGFHERHDIYTNGGMLLMNLCYGLYYNQIAHCILNWSKSPREDVAIRKIVDMKPSEEVVALVACGETPDEFYVAGSPRKAGKDILIIHK